MAGINDTFTPIIGPDVLNEALQRLNVPVADLSKENPRGRIDVLASRVIERGVRVHAPELARVYDIARPLIDGQIAKFLGAIRLPVRKEGQE